MNRRLGRDWALAPRASETLAMKAHVHFIALGPGFVADRFDVVPVGTDNERRVVVRVIVRAQARRPFAPGARRKGRAIEGIDLLAALGGERDMKVRGLLLRLEQ